MTVSSVSSCELIKCECGRRFPVNPLKHPRDDHLYCPFCRRPVKNPYKQRILPSFDPRWLKRKIDRWRYYREVDKFLKEYGFKTEILDPNTGKMKTITRFSLSDWKQGKRPRITVEDVIAHLPRGASEIEIRREIERINRLLQGDF